MLLSAKQLDRLSELFMNLAVGMFLAAIVVQAIAVRPTILDSLRSIAVGLFFVYLSIKTIEQEGV